MNFADKTIGSLETGDSSFEGFLLDNRYKIIRKIGEGGMGAVFLAEDTALDNRLVAIKSLPLIVADNERSLKQLKKEAKLALKLSHPNIVTLRSFETSNFGPYLVMDYIAGKTLEETLTEKEQLSGEEVLALFRPIAEALDYAHTQGVIHRDIKPSNIMIREDGIPFIMDFGIAREMKESFTRLTGKDTSGTLPYMSPEQIRGALPSPAQDVYSLAVTMYECLTGNPPFCRGDIHYQILHEQVDGSKLPDGLRESVLKGLSKDPADRQKTCGELVRAISKEDIRKRREEREIEEGRKTARELVENGRLEEALIALQKIEKAYPGRPEIAADARQIIARLKADREAKAREAKYQSAVKEASRLESELMFPEALLVWQTLFEEFGERPDIAANLTRLTRLIEHQRELQREKENERKKREEAERERKEAEQKRLEEEQKRREVEQKRQEEERLARERSRRRLLMAGGIGSVIIALVIIAYGFSRYGDSGVFSTTELTWTPITAPTYTPLPTFTPVSTQTPTNTPTRTPVPDPGLKEIILYDDFNDGNCTNVWQIIQGEKYFDASTGSLKYNAPSSVGAGIMQIKQNVAYGSWKWRTKVEGNGHYSFRKIMFVYLDSDNFYFIEHGEPCRDSDCNQTWKLRKKFKGVVYDLASCVTGPGFDLGVWRTCRIQRSPSQGFKIFIDDMLVMKSNDNDITESNYFRMEFQDHIGGWQSKWIDDIYGPIN